MEEKNNEDYVFYREVRSVKIGELHRFKIEYSPTKSGSTFPHESIWVKVRNSEILPMRAAYLAGPYILYVDCTSEDYKQDRKCFVSSEQPAFEPQLLPGQSFYNELQCHSIKDTYVWTIDVIPQIIFNTAIDVDFEITIGSSKKALYSTNAERLIQSTEKFGSFIPDKILHIKSWDVNELWSLPVPNVEKPVHLVILTHGLHSNVSADMFYLKEQLDSLGENLVVKGFFRNVGKTERGIKYLGARVAEYVITLVKDDDLLKGCKVDKISFIGHSLGGLVQTFAIGYIQLNFPWFFEEIAPVNFITVASPLLGVIHENPMYVKVALLFGAVGKTGQEIGLKLIENDSKPLLLLLPTGPTHDVLKKFERRTVYANVVNDGIVPLRTSSLLFLDYRALQQVLTAEQSDLNMLPGKSELIEDTKFLPMLAFFSYFMPQKSSSEQNSETDLTYTKFQTSNGGTVEDHVVHGVPAFTAPQSSVIETATSLILPPLPSTKYIMDPAEREDVVVHDKLYKPEDIPEDDPVNHLREKIEASSGTFKKKLLEKMDLNEFKHLEGHIAREYHKGMTWRKVIVKLRLDAHNNIIVRRKYANAYGWPVIDHIVHNHFSTNPQIPDSSHEMVSGETKGEDEADSERSTDSETEDIFNIDNENHALLQIMSRDKIFKEISSIDKQAKHNDGTEAYDLSWMQKTEEDTSLFALGPTGLLSEVSDRLVNLRNTIIPSAKKSQSYSSPANPEEYPNENLNLDLGEIDQMGFP